MPKIIGKTRKLRAMSHKNASRKKKQGHKDEKIFAKLIGGKVKSGTGKQDVVDKQGGVHSVKGGEKKWQIFLYGENRFKTDQNIPGSDLFIKCIESFPQKWEEYKENKQKYKFALQPVMRNLKDFLSKANNKKDFLQKAFFNNEIDYLTIKDNNDFYVFNSGETIEIMDKSTDVENSKARTKGQTDDLKVVFKLGQAKKTTIGEIELRTDRKEKFRLVKFWMFREKTLNLLKNETKTEQQKYGRIFVCGKAINKFRL